MRKPEHLDEEDGKLNICLACNNALAGTLGQDLILCECCPAAFHAQCAGYASIEEIPKGDWLCWGCASCGDKYLFPKTKFQGRVGGRVLVGYAEPGSKDYVTFYEARVKNIAGRMLHVVYSKYKDAECLPLDSPRIWHGTLDRRAWIVDGVHWAAGARQEDYVLLAEAQRYLKWLDTQRAQQAQQRPAASPPKQGGLGRQESSGAATQGGAWGEGQRGAPGAAKLAARELVQQEPRGGATSGRSIPKQGGKQRHGRDIRREKEPQTGPAAEKAQASRDEGAAKRANVPGDVASDRKGIGGGGRAEGSQGGKLSVTHFAKKLAGEGFGSVVGKAAGARSVAPGEAHREGRKGRAERREGREGRQEREISELDKLKARNSERRDGGDGRCTAASPPRRLPEAGERPWKAAAASRERGWGGGRHVEEKKKDMTREEVRQQKTAVGGESQRHGGSCDIKGSEGGEGGVSQDARRGSGDAARVEGGRVGAQEARGREGLGEAGEMAADVGVNPKLQNLEKKEKKKRDREGGPVQGGKGAGGSGAMAAGVEGGEKMRKAEKRKKIEREAVTAASRDHAMGTLMTGEQGGADDMRGGRGGKASAIGGRQDSAAVTKDAGTGLATQAAAKKPRVSACGGPSTIGGSTHPPVKDAVHAGVERLATKGNSKKGPAGSPGEGGVAQLAEAGGQGVSGGASVAERRKVEGKQGLLPLQQQRQLPAGAKASMPMGAAGTEEGSGAAAPTTYATIASLEGGRHGAEQVQHAGGASIPSNPHHLSGSAGVSEAAMAVLDEHDTQAPPQEGGSGDAGAAASEPTVEDDSGNGSRGTSAGGSRKGGQGAPASSAAAAPLSHGESSSQGRPPLLGATAAPSAGARGPVQKADGEPGGGGVARKAKLEMPPIPRPISPWQTPAQAGVAKERGALGAGKGKGFRKGEGSAGRTGRGGVEQLAPSTLGRPFKKQKAPNPPGMPVSVEGQGAAGSAAAAQHAAQPLAPSRPAAAAAIPSAAAAMPLKAAQGPAPPLPSTATVASAPAAAYLLPGVPPGGVGGTAPLLPPHPPLNAAEVQLHAAAIQAVAAAATAASSAGSLPPAQGPFAPPLLLRPVHMWPREAQQELQRQMALHARLAQQQQGHLAPAWPPADPEHHHALMQSLGPHSGQHAAQQAEQLAQHVRQQRSVEAASQDTLHVQQVSPAQQAEQHRVQAWGTAAHPSSAEALPAKGGGPSLRARGGASALQQHPGPAQAAVTPAIQAAPQRSIQNSKAEGGGLGSDALDAAAHNSGKDESREEARVRQQEPPASHGGKIRQGRARTSAQAGAALALSHQRWEAGRVRKIRAAPAALLQTLARGDFALGSLQAKPLSQASVPQATLPLGGGIRSSRSTAAQQAQRQATLNQPQPVRDVVGAWVAQVREAQREAQQAIPTTFPEPQTGGMAHGAVQDSAARPATQHAKGNSVAGRARCESTAAAQHARQTERCGDPWSPRRRPAQDQGTAAGSDAAAGAVQDADAAQQVAPAVMAASRQRGPVALAASVQERWKSWASGGVPPGNTVPQHFQGDPLSAAQSPPTSASGGSGTGMGQRCGAGAVPALQGVAIAPHNAAKAGTEDGCMQAPGAAPARVGAVEEVVPAGPTQGPRRGPGQGPLGAQGAPCASPSLTGVGPTPAGSQQAVGGGNWAETEEWELEEGEIAEGGECEGAVGCGVLLMARASGQGAGQQEAALASGSLEGAVGLTSSQDLGRGAANGVVAHPRLPGMHGGETAVCTSAGGTAFVQHAAGGVTTGVQEGAALLEGGMLVEEDPRLLEFGALPPLTFSPRVRGMLKCLQAEKV